MKEMQDYDPYEMPFDQTDEVTDPVCERIAEKASARSPAEPSEEDSRIRLGAMTCLSDVIRIDSDDWEWPDQRPLMAKVKATSGENERPPVPDEEFHRRIELQLFNKVGEQRGRRL